MGYASVLHTMMLWRCTFWLGQSDVDVAGGCGIVSAFAVTFSLAVVLYLWNGIARVFLVLAASAWRGSLALRVTGCNEWFA